MLEIKLPQAEIYDENTGRFVTIQSKTLRFEHSLLSLSEWESRHRKHFIGNDTLSPEEIFDYILCMALDPIEERDITQDVVMQVVEYISDQPTATTISPVDDGKGRSSRLLTSEVIYANMANGQVPFSCESWNLHRLLILLGVIGEMNKDPKEMSQKDAMLQQAQLNAKRKQQMAQSKARV